MAFEGNLETMPVADLLQWAANGRQSGTIRVASGETTKMVYIEKGKIVSCTSTHPREVLGHFLVSHGAIGEETLQRAVMGQEREGGLLGQILVEQGAVEQETLERMLRLKAEEAIFDLFTWSEGHFSFRDGDLPDVELVPVSLDVAGLVLEGTRRLDEWRRIREVIPSPLCVPVAVGEIGGDGELSAGRAAVLASVDDDRSIEDICLHTHSTEFFVCETLFAEINRGRLKIVRPRVVSTAVADRSGASAGVLLETARDQLSNGELERAVRYIQAAASLEPANRGLRREVAALETEIRTAMKEAGVAPTAVPRVVIGLDELSRLDLEPSAGFILSRIDGTSSVASIVKISPLPEIDALLVVWQLVKGGQVEV